MSHDDKDRTLALAGIYQAAALVDQIARTGISDSSALEATIGSVLRLDTPDVPTVFGGAEGVALGLRTLLAQLDNQASRNNQISRYAVSLLHLERRLAKQPQMSARIGSGIQATQRQAEHFNATHGAVLGALANLYEETFSTLRFRINVSGEQTHLANPDNVNKVRALLLAGVRAAVLHRQCGGRAWTLLLRRSRTLNAARELLASLPQP
jgi:high frequency lysogenization protein